MEALRCRGGERTIDNCAWSVPDAACADHSHDAVVFCSNAAGGVIPDGVARLLGPDGAPSLSGSGRLEVYHSGAWGSVCTIGFAAGSAAVACKSMGFEGHAFRQCYFETLLVSLFAYTCRRVVLFSSKSSNLLGVRRSAIFGTCQLWAELWRAPSDAFVVVLHRV